MRKSIMILAFILSVVFFSVASSSGSELYSKCRGCHGANGEKKAMGVGEALQGQSASDIASKLKGYQDGSYGGSKKAIMASQAKRLSEEDIAALADFISKF